MRYLFFSLLVAAFALPLPAQNVSTYVRSSGPGATIQVLASHHASYRVPRTIYGTFLENIGVSIFGGVSAQLLDNPSLETYPASLSTLSRRFAEPQFQHSNYIGLPLPWLPLWKNENRRYEPRWGHAANSQRYLTWIFALQVACESPEGIYMIDGGNAPGNLEPLMTCDPERVALLAQRKAGCDPFRVGRGIDFLSRGRCPRLLTDALSGRDRSDSPVA